MLTSHQHYEDQWKEMETNRSDRFQNYANENEPRKVENWMNGLAGLKSERVRRVKSSTGRHFGTQQKRSVISYVDDYNQLNVAREVVSYSRHFD